MVQRIAWSLRPPLAHAMYAEKKTPACDQKADNVMLRKGYCCVIGIERDFLSDGFVRHILAGVRYIPICEYFLPFKYVIIHIGFRQYGVRLAAHFQKVICARFR